MARIICVYQKNIEGKLQSDQAEFIAVYGRRRIGKTYLIRELLSNRFSFAMSGVLNGDKSEQFQAFSDALEDYGYKGEKPKNWMKLFAACNCFSKRN